MTIADKVALCTVPGCMRKHEAKGYCDSHYKRFKALGDVMADKPLRTNINRKNGAPCTVAGCTREQYSRMFCKTHYQRQLKHGHVMADKPLRTNKTRQQSC